MTDVPDQQFSSPRFDHRPTVSRALASGIIFSPDQQHLRIKAFYGTSENAVKTQTWVAVSVYVLVAIVKKQLAQDLSLHRILQILSVTAFDKTRILEGFSNFSNEFPDAESSMQLNLFD